MRREYVVEINGMEHTFDLNDEQVKLYPGARPVERKSDQPKNKSRAPKNKDAE